MLIEAGASINCRTRSGATPLFVAAKRGHLKVGMVGLDRTEQLETIVVGCSQMSQMYVVLLYQVEIKTKPKQRTCPAIPPGDARV